MRYTGPKCRLCRREGVKLFLKGERCFTNEKCRDYPPGMHGRSGKKQTEYGKLLREKQKAKRYFGVTEKYFQNAYKKAGRMDGRTGTNLIQILKRRLDNIIYESGLVCSRNTARQMVTHGFFTVNNKKAQTASMQLNIGDVIELKKKDKKDNFLSPLFKDKKKVLTPRWLKVDPKEFTCEVIDIPNEKELEMQIIDPQLIVEYYSR